MLRNRISALLGASVTLASVVGATPASAAVPASCAATGLAVAPLQSSVFYVDEDTDYLGSYVGYAITNAGDAAQDGLWVRLEGFTGGVVAPGTGGATTAAVPLGSLAAGATTPSYAYLKASAHTQLPQGHAVVVYRGRPGAGGTEVCREAQTILAVEDVIKAAANKVTGATGPSTASLGGTFKITVDGDTGTIGAGFATDPGVVRFSPAVAASWPSDAFRLTAVEHQLPLGSMPVADRLSRSGQSGAAKAYRVEYTFRVVGPTSTPTPIVPVQNIASGTQVKHTDPDSFATLAPIPVVTSAARIDVAARGTSPHVAGTPVPLTAKLVNDGTTPVSIDEVTLTLPGTWAAVAGTWKVGGVAVGDPFSGGAGVLRLVGPFDVAPNATLPVTFDATAGTAGSTGAFSVVGALAGGQVDSTVAPGDDKPATTTLAVLGAPDAVDDTESVVSGVEEDVDVLANDQGAAGPTVTIVSGPENGTASVVGGRLRYRSTAGYVGTDAVTYRLTTAGGSDTATLTLTSVAPTTPPEPPTTPEAAPTPANETSTGIGVAKQSVSLTVPQGGAVRLLSGSTLVTSLTVTGEGAYELDVDTGVVSFVPVLGFSGSAAPVGYRVTDAGGRSGDATYTPAVTKPAGPSAPAATSTGIGTEPQSARLDEPTAGDVTLLDAEGVATDRVTVVGEGAYVLTAHGAVTFTPVLGFSGEVEGVAYRVTDAYGQTADGTYVPTVTKPKGPAAPAETSTGVGTAAHEEELGRPEGGSVRLLDGAGEPKASITVAGVGSYVLDGTTVTFSPVLGFSGEAEGVAYRVTDAYGQTADGTYVPTVTKPKGPSAPAETSTGVGTAAHEEELGRPEGGSVQLLDGAGEPTASITVLGVGIYVLDGTTVTFSPVLGFSGEAEGVAYRVTDAYGQSADGAYVPTVTKPKGPSAPAETSTGVGTAEHEEELGQPEGGSVRLLDGAGEPTASIAVAGVGSYVLDGTTVSFTPVLGFSGEAEGVAYRVTDAYGQTADGTYVPTVMKPVGPSAPTKTSRGIGTTPQAQTLKAPAGGSVRLVDADGRPTDAVTVPGEGRYVLDPATGTVTFTPVLGFSGKAPGVAYRVTDAYGQETDGKYVPTVAAPAPSQAPSVSSTGEVDTPQSSALDVPAGGSVALVGPDGGPTGTLIVAGVGTYELDAASGVVTFVPVEGFSGQPPTAGYLATDAYGQVTVGRYAPEVVARRGAPAAAAPLAVPAQAEAPEVAPATIAATRRCTSNRVMTINFLVDRVRLTRVTVSVNGKRTATLRGGARKAKVDMRGMGSRRVEVVIVGVTPDGKRMTAKRTYRPCTARRVGPPLPTLRLR